MKQVHRALLDAVRSNEDGTRRDLDPEFLHDLRVAVRRARTVLGQVKEVFPEQVVERFRRELAWLGQVTGPTRDLDVYRLKLQGYRRELAGAASDLDGLGEYLERHRSEEQARLAKVLVGARYQRLVNAWQSFVDRPVPAHSGLAHAERPIVEVAAGRIHKVWKRVVARGRAIDAASPAEELHRLRIDCKKLRYLLEIFRSLFAADEVAALVRSLKQLQDCLGDYNDYEVQQEMLGVFARGMAEEGSAPVPTLLAMGRLVERLSQAQAAERERFEKRFRRFADDANHRRFKELFGAKAVARRLEVPGSGG